MDVNQILIDFYIDCLFDIQTYYHKCMYAIITVLGASTYRTVDTSSLPVCKETIFNIKNIKLKYELFA